MAQRDVAINLLTKLQDKGFKDLEKSTKKSDKLLGGLSKQLASTFSVVAITAYGKTAVKAFLSEEKAVRRLNIALQNTSQGLKALQAEDFISNLQRTARVADDQLRPALTQLINAGIDFEQSQKLLKTALDVSAGSGKDLQTVVIGLSRAFAGNNTALTRLNLGLTKAQLKAASFDDIVALLTAKFAGQADAAALTYSGRLAAISIAADEASETIGAGLVKALDLATASSTGAEIALDGVSKSLQEVFVGIGAIIGESRQGGLAGYFALVKEAAQSAIRQGLNPFAAALDFIRTKGKDALTVTPTQLELVKKSIAEQKRAAELQKILAKINSQIIKEQKKSDAEKKRSEAVEKLRKTIQYKFDIEAINQQAALRRNLSASDKDRLLQLIALKTSDYQDDEEAIKTLKAATQGRYTEAMALEQMYALLKAAGFAQDKTAIAALAALDPKIKFTDNLDDVIAKLKALIEGKYTINIGATITVPAIPSPGTSSSAGIGPGDFRKADEGRRAPSEGVTPGGPIIKPPAINLPGEIGGEPAFAARPLFPDISAFRRFEEMGTSDLRNLYGAGAVPSNFDVGRFRMRDEGGVTVNVNVSGSVISQNDLVSAVTDAVYQSQRTGNALVLSEI